MIKKINFVQLKLDLSTNFRIKLRGKFREEKYENEMNEIYHKLVDLRNMYGIVLDYISTEIIELIKVEDLNERERKVTSIRKSENKINKEAKEKFLDIFKKYKEEDIDGKYVDTELEIEVKNEKYVAGREGSRKYIELSLEQIMKKDLSEFTYLFSDVTFEIIKIDKNKQGRIVNIVVREKEKKKE